MNTNIDENTLINFIKMKYPKIIFNPLKLKESDKLSGSLGFIVTDDKLIIGYINSNGNLCKLIEPIDLSDLSNEKFIKMLQNLPIVKGASENLLKIFEKTNLSEIKSKSKSEKGSESESESESESDKDSESDKESESESEKVIQELIKIKEEKLEIKKKYDVLVGENDNNMLLIKKEYMSNLDDIKKEYDNEINKLKEHIKNIEDNREVCKNKLLNEKSEIIESIKMYKSQMTKYITDIVDKNMGYDELNNAYIKLLKERDSINVTLQNLSETVEKEKEAQKNKNNKESVNSENVNSENEKLNEEIRLLRNTINDIQNELDRVQKKFNEKELEHIALLKFNKNCISSLLNEKDTIIENIKQYNIRWLDWVNNNNVNIENEKIKLKKELDVIFTNLKRLIDSKNEYIYNMDLSSKEKDILINKLNNNISDIKYEVNKSLNEQLLQLSIKNEELNGKDKNHEREIKEKDNMIDELTKKLDYVKSLLDKNALIDVKKETDYDGCYSILHKFMNVNNVFYRKREIISILDKIINGNMSSFSNLNEQMKDNIKLKFESVKIEVNKHIDFLNLNKYIESPNIKLFKSKSTVKNVPNEFCDELNNISNYWESNKGLFGEQDRILTNIYEDLSGAVRVYIKIKPLIGVEQKDKTVYIENNTKKIIVDCSNVPSVNKIQTFGEFYGVFDETYTNKDMYTGVKESGDISELKIDIDNINENVDTISPGLYSTFKQVEDGYSIVLFGYGLSGSGKTYTLIGDKNVPGLLHYGLSNLAGVKNIKLKYLFEQYIDKFVPTINKIRGKIINLVREVPQMRNYSIDETREFESFIGNKINVNNLHINDITDLTILLEKYRIEHNRIKKTPNNPVSSRSHLYMVYEISFENGKSGYITIVDTAGRESPKNIYDVFIDTSKNINLTTILGPTGGSKVVERYMRQEYIDSYNPEDVFEILKEGFYINETINHLIYFFNKKNYKTTKVVSQTNLDKYNNERYYVNPESEETTIDPINNCLMVPILKFLDVISNRNKNEGEYKPTKFICIVNVRKDTVYCPSIFSSLNFAKKITSS